MAQATTATIKTQLETGTYPANTLHADNIYDYEQYLTRRGYPSCEIITSQPESTSLTASESTITVGYEIRYYTRNVGGRTDEIATQKSVEDEIMSLIGSMTLQDHLITFESRNWTRLQVQRDGTHPAYTVSTLKIVVRQVTATTLTDVGSLTFVLAGSTVETDPAANYTYSNIFDVDIDVGYDDVQEGYTASHIPVHFSGHLQGKLICSILVKSADLGNTGDKLNQLPKLMDNGQKPEFKFSYVNKTSDDTTMTSVFTCEADSVKMRYTVSEGTVFQLIATLTSDVTIT